MRGTASQLLRGRGAQQANGVDDLHPFVQTMSLVDLESCLALENACFEEHERESRKTVRSIISIYLLEIALCGSILSTARSKLLLQYPTSHIQESKKQYCSTSTIKQAHRQTHA